MNLSLTAAFLVRAAAADNTVSPGVLGFAVVALLGVATWLLVRSMRRQIKRIDIPEGGTPTRAEPVDPDGPGPVDPSGGTDETHGPRRRQ
ncbi:MAG: hypothetical protein ABI807_01110 [Sporichthyaceae bacterium]